MQGYSIVELLVSMGIIFTFSAFAVPSLMRSYRGYQMDDIAGQMAGQLKLTRYEAIRRNTPMNCVSNQQTTPSSLFTMSTQDPNAPNANGRQIAYAGPAAMVPAASVPNSGSLAAAVNVATLTTINPSNGSIAFDGRGAKTTAGISVYWMGNANYGWRAVTVMPSGSVQVWSSATGTWQQLS
jgi:Tfp pilus assembly protein FimT